MRADRLLQVVALLRTHGRLSATELATRLEVSVRTVLRDMEALSAAGVPVYAERGRTGGFALVPGFRPAVEDLTPAETQALLLSGSGSAQAAGLDRSAAERRPQAVGAARAGAHPVRRAAGRADRRRPRRLVRRAGRPGPPRHAPAGGVRRPPAARALPRAQRRPRLVAHARPVRAAAGGSDLVPRGGPPRPSAHLPDRPRRGRRGARRGQRAPGRPRPAGPVARAAGRVHPAAEPDRAARGGRRAPGRGPDHAGRRGQRPAAGRRRGARWSSRSRCSPPTRRSPRSPASPTPSGCSTRPRWSPTSPRSLRAASARYAEPVG